MKQKATYQDGFLDFLMDRWCEKSDTKLPELIYTNLRRRAAIPANPNPIKAMVAGSGTVF